jgi:hypothetical protein
MGIEDKWWMLHEDEDISFDSNVIYELRDGNVLDGRTSDVIGTYTVTERGADLLLNEEHGERRIIKFRMSFRVEDRDGKFEVVNEPFDLDASGYSVQFSTERFEAYKATRPANDFETDEEEFARLDREAEEFGHYYSHGFVYREDADLIETGKRLDRECAVRMRREAMAVAR